MSKTKYIILITILFITTIIYIVNFDKTKDTIADNQTNMMKVNKKTISMMLETDNGNYEKSTSSNWPTEGYVFNSELSRCENGGELSWDEENKKVIMTNNTSDKCYVYFDIKPKPYFLDLGTKLTINSKECGPFTMSECEIPVIGNLSQQINGGHIAIYYLVDFEVASDLSLIEVYDSFNYTEGWKNPVNYSQSYAYYDNYYVIKAEGKTEDDYLHYKFSKDGYQDICINGYKQEVVDCNDEKWMYTGKENSN